MAHSHSELVEGVLDNIINCDPALASSFRARGLHNLHRQTEELSLPETLILAQYWDFFNEIFFSNALHHERSGFDIIPPWYEEWKDNIGETHGYTDDNRRVVFRRDEVRSHISILEILESEIEEQTQRMRSYIGTMLHEMVHAFVINYACLCDECQERNKIHEGQEGHGRTWQTMAHAVESFCCNPLGLELELNREVSLAKEIYESGAEISARDCRLWELSYDAVEQRATRFKALETIDDSNDSDGDDDQNYNAIDDDDETSDGKNSNDNRT